MSSGLRSPSTRSSPIQTKRLLVITAAFGNPASDLRSDMILKENLNGTTRTFSYCCDSTCCSRCVNIAEGIIQSDSLPGGSGNWSFTGLVKQWIPPLKSLRTIIFLSLQQNSNSLQLFLQIVCSINQVFFWNQEKFLYIQPSWFVRL